MPNELITIDEFCKSLLKMAQDSVEKTNPDASKEEKEKMVIQVLQGFGYGIKVETKPD